MDQSPDGVEESLELNQLTETDTRQGQGRFQNAHISRFTPCDETDNRRNNNRWQCLMFIGLILGAIVVVKIVFSEDPKERVSETSGHDRISVIPQNKTHLCRNFPEIICTTNQSQPAGGINQTVMPSTLIRTRNTMLLATTSLLEDAKTNHELRSVNMAKEQFYICKNTSFSTLYSNLSWLPFHNHNDERANNHWPITEEQWNQSEHSLEEYLARMFFHNNPNIFGLGISEDEDNPSTNLLTFNKRHPIQTDTLDSASTNTKYAQSHKLFGFVHNVKDSMDIHKFEKDLGKLLEASNCDDDKRDIWSERIKYRKVSLDFIQREIPQINFIALVQHIFDILKFEEQISPEMIVYFPCFEFFQGLANLIEEAGRRTVVNFLILQFAVDYLEYLDSDLFQSWLDSPDDLKANEDKLRSSRSTRCAGIVMDWFGTAVAHLYEQKYPKTSEKKIVEEMMKYFKMAFQQVISKQDWIPPAGKDQFETQLVEKVMQMKVKIGYPEYVRNATLVDTQYDGLVLNESSFISNFLKLIKFQTAKDFMLIRVKRDGDLKPQLKRVATIDVNAYYNPKFNEIGIPLGMLHTPMFDESNPMFLNFANLGFHLAHEIVHGFDNDGLHYDKDGNLTSWWPDEAKIAFQNKAICLVEQYSKFQIPLMDTFVNGNRTLSENICDNAALPLSFLAYEMWVKDHKVEPPLPGLNLTIKQIFYIAFGQLWCEAPSKETSQFYTQDVHSPHPLRVLGVVQNSVDFGNTFGCPAGSPINPVHKCSLWS